MSQQTAKTLNQAEAQAFADRMLDILNKASAALMISVGHRTELFDTMADLAPATVERIANAAGLNERYVREWLGAMVAARIVDYDPTGGTYFLPRERAAFLTRAASPNNIASTAQFIPVLASVENEIVEAFRKGGGVPYSSYPRFHEVMAEESDQTTVSGLIDAILPIVPGLTEKLREGIDVMDVGCGRGRALILMAGTFPKSRFTGYDFSVEAIADAAAEAARQGLSNIRFEARDVARIDEPAHYGLVTAFDAIHDQAAPREVLKAIARALRPDGVFLMQDIYASSHVHNNSDNPLGTFIYTVSCLHCMTVSLALGGEGLGAAWGEERALELLSEAGFNPVEVKRLPHDIINNYYVAGRG
ncbi:MAG TPA: methyltransferase domain-containing protein [Blastocatellia bacterium]|jgi:2-polyprenyl-3-methyl-5-hydroxy-6-metoxy-1,4-benzoquinol methylase|nr:methyltransferase domain-containing protein [Blastocatellia bacterium]